MIYYGICYIYRILNVLIVFARCFSKYSVYLVIVFWTWHTIWNLMSYSRGGTQKIVLVFNNLIWNCYSWMQSVIWGDFIFDDIEEGTTISREVNRLFLHTFVLYGSTVLYHRYVTVPTTTDDPSTFEELFASAGINGCIGSSDATRIDMLSCAYWATNNQLGHKLSVPSRTYNMMVSHCCQILLGSTCGHLSTWNDKTIILYDELIWGVNNGTIYADHEFTLFEYDCDRNMFEVAYKGVWFMVDNAYLSWYCTVPPLKDGVTYQHVRFSQWLESMRKGI